MHLIGLGLKKEFPYLKWIADFRDPWSELDLLDDFSLTKLSIKKHKTLESIVLNSADITLTVSLTWAANLKQLGAKRVELITNGYDESDFQKNEKLNDKFIIGHYGLLNHLRNPKNLWKTLNYLCANYSDFDKKLEIHLAGNIDTEVITEIKHYPSLKDKVKQFGFLRHTEVLEHYNEASLLLLLLFNSKSGVGNYPGKIFEYFAAQKPILAFGPHKSDVQKMITRTKSGYYYSYEVDIDLLQEDILHLFKRKKEPFKIDNIKSFSRKELTKELATLIHAL